MASNKIRRIARQGRWNRHPEDLLSARAWAGAGSDPAAPNPQLEAITLALLLAVGIALSILYFGHRAVPNSDFPGFVKVARDLLHGQLPGSMKRLPVLGLLQVAFSGVAFFSACPILTGGLILNCVMYSAGILVLYRLMRLTSGAGFSFFVTLIAALNPLMLSLLVNPIVEITLTFFILMTLYCIVTGSRWSYAWAMAASMTRYEGFALIGIALLADLFRGSSAKERIRAVVLCCLAATPLAVWLMIARPSMAEPDTNYLRLFFQVEHRNGWAFGRMLLESAFIPMLPWAESIRAIFGDAVLTQETVSAIQSRETIFRVAVVCAGGLCFLIGAASTLQKKRRAHIVIVLFWMVYFSVHSLQGYLVDRYAAPLVWLTILIAAMGLHASLDYLRKWIPGPVRGAALAAVVVGAMVWIGMLWGLLPKMIVVSPASRYIVYVGLGGILCFLLAYLWMVRTGNAVPVLAGGVIAAMAVISNQYSVAGQMGTGDEDREFRMLAEWFRQNAKPGEKLATTFSEIVQLFVPEAENACVHITAIPGTNPAEFAQGCKQLGVVYLAWDSRIESFGENDYYYKLWGMKKIQPLMAGVSTGPYQFLHRIEAPSGRYILLYRLDYAKIP